MAPNGSHDSNESRRSGDVVVPFLVGAVVGGVAGAVAGTLLSHQTSQLVASIIGLIDRRLSDADRERLRFELLLQ